MDSWIRQSLSGLTKCISPPICYGCGVSLTQEDQFACPDCLDRLPYTDFHLLKANPFIDKFFGRIPIHSAGSLLYFSKEGIARSLIHDLKYRGQSDVGKHLGLHYGHILCEATLFQNIDMIIPVPLHPKRLAQRGYNQSEVFAEGLSQSMDVPMCADIVIRHRETKTQTKKNRIERFENVDGAFSVTQPSRLNRCHVLLVDDVLTTGATLEGCAQEFTKLPNVLLSMATIGFAYQ